MCVRRINKSPGRQVSINNKIKSKRSFISREKNAEQIVGRRKTLMRKRVLRFRDFATIVIERPFQKCVEQIMFVYKMKIWCVYPNDLKPYKNYGKNRV